MPNALHQSHPGRIEKKRPWFAFAVFFLLTVQTGLMAYSATVHSPTDLEPAFLASGIAHWEFGRFEPYRVNPPLVRMIAAVPAVALGYRGNWSSFSDRPGSRCEFTLGDAFVQANGRAGNRLFLYGRWACIPFSLIGTYFVSRWARELYGPVGGVTAAFVYVFEPNLLAHGELITSDAASTACGVLAGYAFWRWLKSPGWSQALAAGSALGLAELTKMSWLILFGLWPMAWLAWRFLPPLPERHADTDCSCPAGDVTAVSKPSSPPLKQLAAIFAVAVYLINLGYAFDGVGAPLSSFRFVSKSLSGADQSGISGNRFDGTLIGRVPILLPRQFVLGFDCQKKDFEDFANPSYLRGIWRNRGWWYYYIYALLVKVPCGIWGLLALIVTRRILKTCKQGPRFRDEVVLLAPAAAILFLVSSQTAFSIHFRYALPVLGFLAVFLGQAGGWLRRPRSLSAIFAIVLLASSALSSLTSYPNHLAYFNELVGGTKCGAQHLLGSSLDWGQGTGEVVEWIRKNEATLPIEICAWNQDLVIALLSESPQQSKLQEASKHIPRLILYSADEFSKRQLHWNSLQFNNSEVVIRRFPSGRVVTRVEIEK